MFLLSTNPIKKTKSNSNDSWWTTVGGELTTVGGELTANVSKPETCKRWSVIAFYAVYSSWHFGYQDCTTFKSKSLIDDLDLTFSCMCLFMFESLFFYCEIFTQLSFSPSLGFKTKPKSKLACNLGSYNAASLLSDSCCVSEADLLFVKASACSVYSL